MRPPTVPLDESALPGAGANHCRVEEAELRDAIMSALRSLSPGNRICTSLHYLDGYSVKEVAAFLDLPEGTVKRRLHDSRKHLQAQMIPFAAWADALEQGRALRFGQGYNGEVWALVPRQGCVVPSGSQGPAGRKGARPL